jgi:hypothetical protein
MTLFDQVLTLARRLPLPERLRLRDALTEPVIEEPTDALGWPIGFFEATYGSCADDPIVREPEGDFEQREPIA